ncbi:hypothetical protein [Streptomyces luteocolor]|uniref:hypothetical protein n=1 Tax=Streptomyces luteocolor TaxID=285500 RepID=UPI0008531150
MTEYTDRMRHLADTLLTVMATALGGPDDLFTRHTTTPHWDFTLNIGDLMARWSGDRWRSGRHRVLPPPPDAPHEELTSLVYFHSCAPGTTVESLPAPLGRRSYAPVRAGEYFESKMAAIRATD